MIRFIAFLAILACACAHSSSRQSSASVEQAGKATTHAEEQSAASGRTTAGPETITTTVEEWGVAGSEGADAPAVSASPSASATGGKPTSTTATLLVKRTVTVDQRGPLDSSWMASASGTRGAEERSTLGIQTASQSESKTSYWPPWPYLVGAAAAACGALWLARGKLKLALEAVRAMVG